MFLIEQWNCPDGDQTSVVESELSPFPSPPVITMPGKRKKCLFDSLNIVVIFVTHGTRVLEVS